MTEEKRSMAGARYHVCGIGNAIVDVLARADDSFLDREKLAKGHMRLIDAAEADRLYRLMGPAIETSGGSAANTIAGIASLGGNAAFIGKVADDELGRIFRHDIRSIGVRYETAPKRGGEPTARCLILVTPDGQRTMNTFLGVSPMLANGEVDAKIIGDSGILYLEGYLFDRPEAKRAFHEAAGIARAAGRKVCLSLSDGFCVDRHRPELLELIRTRIDILFANTDEITSLYQASFAEAAGRARADVALAALTRSEKGSIIVAGDETIEIPAEPVAKVVDTTGAGDLYAAGVLLGIATHMPLALAGRLGSIAAAEAISHMGPRPGTSLRELARTKGIAI
jgi:sugar/nucleoside kinase (ribokinase family)